MPTKVFENFFTAINFDGCHFFPTNVTRSKNMVCSLFSKPMRYWLDSGLSFFFGAALYSMRMCIFTCFVANNTCKYFATQPFHARHLTTVRLLGGGKHVVHFFLALNRKIFPVSGAILKNEQSY